jgi:hypothetical protein
VNQAQRRIVCAVLSLSTLFVVPQSAQADAIFVDSFESATLGAWYLNTTPPHLSACQMPVCDPWNVVAGVAHSGAFGATDVGNLEMRLDFDGLAVSSITELGFWVFNPNAFALPIGFEFFYSDQPVPNLYLNFFIAWPELGQWDFIDLTSYLAPGKKLVGLGINGVDRYPSEPLPRLYVDDVMVRARVPEASPLLLLALGFSSVAVVRRKRPASRPRPHKRSFAAYLTRSPFTSSR